MIEQIKTATYEHQDIIDELNIDSKTEIERMTHLFGFNQQQAVDAYLVNLATAMARALVILMRDADDK